MKTIRKKILGVCKYLIILGFIATIFCTIFACKKDDGPQSETILPPPTTIEKTIFGKWEITSGHLILENSKFVHINEDNTMSVLIEDALGFHSDYTTNINVVGNQLNVSSFSGTSIHNFTLEDDNLKIIQPRELGEVILKRNDGIPEYTDWIKVLTVAEEGAAPWEGAVDIAFNGSQILYGPTTITGNQIALINPTNFNLEGMIPTTKFARVVEVEKYSGPDRYIFQVDGDERKIYAYKEDDNDLAFDSNDIGYGIRGLASVDETRIWVSITFTKILHLYQYNETHEILSTINLDLYPFGIDYQDGFLYISDGDRIHKCQTSPSFKAIESYRIQNHSPFGIAYDGSNFWLNTISAGEYKLIKVNLSI